MLFIYLVFLCVYSSLKEVWVSVLNITGPLSSWSFADNKLPGEIFFLYVHVKEVLYIFFLLFLNPHGILFSAPERDGNGPPSYICRLSGASSENWTFWLEVIIPSFTFMSCLFMTPSNLLLMFRQVAQET